MARGGGGAVVPELGWGLFWTLRGGQAEGQLQGFWEEF